MAHIKTRETGAGRRYDVQYRINGASRTKTFTRQRDAKAFLDRLGHEAHTGTAVDPNRSRITLAALADQWLAVKGAKRGSSRGRDWSNLRTHILPVLGSRPIVSITKADVQALIDGWVKAGQAPSSIGRQHSTLRAILSYAVDSERLAKNPALKVRLPKMEHAERPELDREVPGRLYKVLGDRDRLFVRVGVETGARWAEIAGLAARHVLVGDRLRIEQQVDRDGNIAPLKTSGSRRTVDIGTELGAELRALADGGEGDDLLFTTSTGAPLHYPNWRARVWLPAVKAAGVDGLRFHDLRSWQATALLAAGVPLKDAQARLGHASASTTADIYARATAAGGRRAADVMAAFFGS